MEIVRLHRKKVYDGLLRLLHWGIALSVVMLLSTAWLSEIFEEGPGEKTVWMMHIYAGYLLAAALVMRVTWGILGPRYAQLSDLWHPSQWRHPLRALKQGAARKFGHDPLASAAYLVAYGILAIMALTGLALAAVEHGVGPLSPWLFDRTALEKIFEGPHEFFYLGVLGFIAVHIGAIIFHEHKEGVPIAQEMVSGYQYRTADPEIPETKTTETKMKDLIDV